VRSPGRAPGDRRPDLTRTPQQELDRRDALVVDSTCGGRVGHGEGADPPGSSGTLPAHERDVVERLCGEIAGAFASDPTSAGTVASDGSVVWRWRRHPEIKPVLPRRHWHQANLGTDLNLVLLLAEFVMAFNGGHWW